MKCFFYFQLLDGNKMHQVKNEKDLSVVMHAFGQGKKKKCFKLYVTIVNKPIYMESPPPPYAKLYPNKL